MPYSACSASLGRRGNLDQDCCFWWEEEYRLDYPWTTE